MVGDMSTKKEVSNNEFNAAIWADIKSLELKIAVLKLKFKPVELAAQAKLHDCNKLAQKFNVKPKEVNAKLLAEELV